MAQSSSPAPSQGASQPAKPQDDPDKTPVFKSQVKSVLVPVVVKDKSNRHVTGLTKADFTILENGKPQLVASVTEIQSGSNAAAIAKAANFIPSRDGFEGITTAKIASNESG